MSSFCLLQVLSSRFRTGSAKDWKYMKQLLILSCFQPFALSFRQMKYENKIKGDLVVSSPFPRGVKRRKVGNTTMSPFVVFACFRPFAKTQRHDKLYMISKICRTFAIHLSCGGRALCLGQHVKVLLCCRRCVFWQDVRQANSHDTIHMTQFTWS